MISQRLFKSSWGVALERKQPRGRCDFLISHGFCESPHFFFYIFSLLPGIGMWKELSADLSEEMALMPPQGGVVSCPHIAAFKATQGKEWLIPRVSAVSKFCEDWHLMLTSSFGVIHLTPFHYQVPFRTRLFCLTLCFAKLPGRVSVKLLTPIVTSVTRRSRGFTLVYTAFFLDVTDHVIFKYVT